MSLLGRATRVPSAVRCVCVWESVRGVRGVNSEAGRVES